MDKKILNRRKELLNGNNGKTEKEWEEQLRSLRNADGLGIHKYFNTKKKSGKPVTGGDTRNFFGQSLEIFRSVYEFQKQNLDNIDVPRLVKLHESYDVLITLVGFSLQPLMHTILTICPCCVYPIVTKETRYFDGNIPVQNYFKHLVSQYGEGKSIAIMEPVIVDTIGSIDAFQKIRQIIQDVGKDKKVAIDITGGKKSMDASAFLAAAIEKDTHIFYVDFEGYDKDKVQCGTEFLNKLDNPYDIYNVDLMNKGKELFDNHNYQAAYEIFEDIEKKLQKHDAFDLSDELDNVRKMKQAAMFCKYWDKFDYEEAWKALPTTEPHAKSLLSVLKKNDEIYRGIKEDEDTYFQQNAPGKSIEKLKEKYEEFLSISEPDKEKKIKSFIDRERKAFQFGHNEFKELLNNLGSVRRINCETLESLRGETERKWFILFSFDLFHNAQRRSSQGRFEDATIRLTRVLEVYAQYRLIEKNQNPFRSNNKHNAWGARAMYNELFGKKSEKAEKLIDLADIRNNLSIIHSIGRGSSDEIRQLENQAKAFLQELWKELDDDLKGQINMTADITELNFEKNAFRFQSVDEICRT